MCRFLSCIKKKITYLILRMKENQRIIVLMDCASLDASIESLRRPQLNHYCNFPLNPHVRLLVGCKDSQSVGVGKSNFTRSYRNTCLINYYIFRCAGSISLTLLHMTSVYVLHAYFIASYMTDF